MGNFKYILDPGSRKFECPECGKKTFVRYLDEDSKEYLPYNLGRCDRQDKCGYYRKPEIKNDSYRATEFRNAKPFTREPEKQTSYLSIHQVKPTIGNYETNNLLIFLKMKFGDRAVNSILEKYLIGTSDQYGGGSTIYYQVDYNKRIRSGKIIQYNPTTGKRRKDLLPPVRWVHKEVIPEFNLKQCLFGEHLLNGNSSPVALFESEKTSLIASLFMTDYICLATGGKENLTPEKCQILKNRKGLIYPDLSINPDPNKSWENRAQSIQCLSGFKVSKLLEEIATDQDRESGLDLADYLLGLDLSHSNTKEGETILKPEIEPIDLHKEEEVLIKPIQLNRNIEIKENWITEIEEIQSLIQSAIIPKNLIAFNVYITDVKLFLESHISYCRSNQGNQAYFPYLERLRVVKNLLSQTIN